MPKNYYNINWQKLVRMLTITELKLPKHLAWLYGLSSPFATLHSRFLAFKKQVDYKLSISPSKTDIQRLLNDRFDVVDRRIRIVKGVEYPALPLFQTSENKPVVFNRKSEDLHKVIYTKSETAQFTVDFIIRVPLMVQFDINEMIAYIADDVLPSKVFKVQII